MQGPGARRAVEGGGGKWHHQVNVPGSRANVKHLRTILLLLLALPVLAMGGLLALAMIALEDRPLVPASQVVEYADVATGKALLKRILLQVETAGERGTTLAVDESELRSLTALGSRGLPWLDADLSLTPSAISQRMTIRVPPTPLGHYLNITLRLAQSRDGIAIEGLQAGALPLPGGWVLPAIAALADRLLPDSQVGLLLASVKGVEIAGDNALFRVQPPADVKARLKQTVRDVQAARLPEGEAGRVAHYYEFLVTLGRQAWRKSVSLDAFISPLLAEARRLAPGSSAQAENRAAIWALAIYFSYGSFENLLGDLVSSQRKLVFPAWQVTLGGRRDLMLHFVYSAGIALATQQGIGFAAGEFKELLDSGSGGSGFSFADLAADRAGVRFVEAATSSEASARALQESMARHQGEGAFFPDITGLREGLGEAQFRAAYGNTASAAYAREVALIDRRISRLPVYGAATPAP